MRAKPRLHHSDFELIRVHVVFGHRNHANANENGEQSTPEVHQRI